MKRIIKSLFIILGTITLLYAPNIYAISGSYTISSNSTVNLDSTFSVTFKVSAKNLFYWQAYITYDTSKLKLVSGSTSFEGEQGQASMSRTLKFKAKATGSAWVKIREGDKDNNINSDGKEISFSTKTKTINIVKPKKVTYSKNNYLKSLSVKNGKLSPTFNKDKDSYTVEMKAGTEKITISAAPADKKATVYGTGSKKVSEGKNTFTIRVEAENGNERKYKLVVNVKELNPIIFEVDGEKYTAIRKEKDLPKTDAMCDSSTITIKDDKIPSLSCEGLKINLIGLKDNDGNISLFVYDKENETLNRYTELSFEKLTIVPIDEKFDIPSSYEETTEKINNTTVKVYKNKEDSKYSIFYGLNIESNKKNIYMYDSEENTIQRFDKDNFTTNKFFNNIIGSNNKLYVYLTYGLAGFLLLTYIVMLVVIIKRMKKPKKIKLQRKRK